MAGNISVSSRMNVWRPLGGHVYFTSLTKASANNNGDSELRPPESTGCASRNGLYNRPKPRHKANYSFVPGQPRGMNLTWCGLKHCLDKYQRVFTQNSQCIVKTDNLYAHLVVGFWQSYFIASIKGFFWSHNNNSPVMELTGNYSIQFYF